MWGIVPAAGAGSRIQPLAFSKELLPVGSRLDQGVERPRAVSEYLIERLVVAGADCICFIIGPGKSDIMDYYGDHVEGVHICYVVQPQPHGLCDAIFAAAPFLPAGGEVAVGLPDTVWFPENGLAALPAGLLAFLLFPVDRPQYFDAVVTGAGGRVQQVQVKHDAPATHWVWGAFRMPVGVLRSLHALWLERGRRDEYIGSLVNAYIDRGGTAIGVRAGETYVDVGTLNGYRQAIGLLNRSTAAGPADPAAGAQPAGSSRTTDVGPPRRSSIAR